MRLLRKIWWNLGFGSRPIPDSLLPPKGPTRIKVLGGPLVVYGPVDKEILREGVTLLKAPFRANRYEGIGPVMDWLCDTEVYVPVTYRPHE